MRSPPVSTPQPLHPVEAGFEVSIDGPMAGLGCSPSGGIVGLRTSEGCSLPGDSGPALYMTGAYTIRRAIKGSRIPHGWQGNTAWGSWYESSVLTQFGFARAVAILAPADGYVRGPGIVPRLPCECPPRLGCWPSGP